MDVVTLQKRQSSARQMDSLRDVIQNLTRSINPLGKLMDFLPEDIDSMHLELNMWRDSYIQGSSELKKERRCVKFLHKNVEITVFVSLAIVLQNLPSNQ